MRKTAVKTGGSGGPYMLVAVCFNSVNVEMAPLSF